MPSYLPFAAVFSVLPFAALAAGCVPATISIPSDGSASYEVPDADTAALRAKTYGAAPDADHVLLLHEGEGYWIPRGDLDAAHVVLGSTSTTYRYEGPDHCAPRDLTIDLGLEEESARTVPAAATLAVAGVAEPKSGIWQYNATPVTFEGCPAMIPRSSLADFGALPPEALKPQRLIFQSPFHPDQLPMSRMTIGWWQEAPNVWQTRVMLHEFGEASINTGQGSFMMWQLTVESDSSIKHTTLVSVGLPPEAVAAFGSDRCNVQSTNIWTRVGD